MYSVMNSTSSVVLRFAPLRSRVDEFSALLRLPRMKVVSAREVSKNQGSIRSVFSR